MTTTNHTDGSNVVVTPDKYGHAFARFIVHGHIVHIESNPDQLWFYDTADSIMDVKDIVGATKCEKCGRMIPI